MARAVVYFEGLNTASVLSHFLRQGIVLYDVKRRAKRCQITVSSASLGEVVAYLREKCYNVSVRNVGASAAVCFCKRRFVAVVMALLLVVSICLASNFCLAVHIDGDVPADVVENALLQLGVYKGCRMDFAVDTVENELCKALDVAYAVVNKRGSTVYVTTVATRTADEPIDMHKRRDVVSDVDGVVTNVVCTNGTACVKVGDKVVAGDVLIAGMRDYGDGHTEVAYAMGRVTVMRTATVQVEYGGTVTRTVPTDETFTATYVRLFGRDYGKLCPFDNYMQSDEIDYLYPWHIAIVRRTYTRTVEVTETAPVEQVADQLKRQAEQRLREICTFEISEITYTLRRDGVTAEATGFVTVE